MNYDSIRYEETINLKDLCIFILKKWRILLVVMLAGAVVLGGYKAMSGPQPVTISSKLVEENTKKLEQLETLQKTIRNNQKTIHGYEKTINSHEKAMVRNQADIQAQEELIASLESIIDTYEQALADAQILLNESLTSENRIEVISQIAELNNSILSSNDQIKDSKQKIAALTEEIAILPDEITALIEEIALVQEDNTDLAEEAETLEESLMMEIVEPTEIGTGDIIKSAILGAVAGAFVICGIAFLQYFFRKTLRSEQELKEGYGFRVIGNLYVPTGKGKIDQLLNRMAGYGEAPDAEKEYALAAAGVQVMSAESSETGRKQILVTGTGDLSVIAKTCEQIQKHLPRDRYELCAVSNPVYAAEALLQIHEKDIVLVEAKDVSDRREISRLAELLQAGKANVIGAIML